MQLKWFIFIFDLGFYYETEARFSDTFMLPGAFEKSYWTPHHFDGIEIHYLMVYRGM